jgi:hypothetical protein
VSDQSLTNGQAARTVKRPAGQALCWQLGENEFLRLRSESPQNFLRKKAWERKQIFELRMPDCKYRFARQFIACELQQKSCHMATFFMA